MNTLLTPQEVADRLKISKRSFYELTRRRDRDDASLPIVKIGSQIRVRSIDLDLWLEARAKESVQ